MTWREDLKGTASFRGVPFRTTDAGLDVGRRGVVNEYPLRDEGAFIDDLGRRARRYDIEGYVIGDDYIAARDELARAFETEGPGELIHPRYGVLWVSIPDPVKFKESYREGGIARFSATFVEAAENLQPSEEGDTAAAVEETAEAVDQAAQDSFVSQLDLQGPQLLTDQVAEEMAGNVESLVSVASLASAADGLSSMVSDAKAAGLGAIGSLVSGIGGGFGSLVPGAALLQDQIGTLLRFAPASLVGALRAIGGSMAASLRTLEGGTAGSSYAGPAAALSALQQMGIADRAAFTTAAAPGLAGSSQSRATRNEVARAELIRRLVTTTQARVLAVAITDDAVGTAQQATQWRDAIVEQIDTELELADPDASTARALSRLRAAVVRDVAARAELLKQRSTFSPVAVLPALVLAHRIYQDAWRADELVQRNAIAHPAFVPVKPLEILL